VCAGFILANSAGMSEQALPSAASLICFCPASATSNLRSISPTCGQGLTLVHFSAQLEPCLAQYNTLHTLNTP